MKNLLKSSLTLAAVSAASMFLANPAQAMILGDGGFNLNGSTTVANPGTDNPTLNFNRFTINVSNGAFAGLSGTPIIKSLSLIDNAPNAGTDAVIESSGVVTDFITGLFLNGNPLAFDLDPTGPDLFGDIVDDTTFRIAGPITGVFRSGNTVLGQGFLGATSFTTVGNNLSNVSLTTTAVPTPALLPGLIGMGAAFVRKRRTQNSQSA